MRMNSKESLVLGRAMLRNYDNDWSKVFEAMKRDQYGVLAVPFNPKAAEARPKKRKQAKSRTSRPSTEIRAAG